MNKIEQLQKTQLNILKELIQICDEHNLKYYAIAGTVLGAVRHKGFIPWDDDIDISMPREDYEKFQEIVSGSGKASGRSSHLSLETIYSHENHDSPIMKLTDTRVKMIAKRKTIKQKVWSAYIDISPMDGLPDNKISRFFHVRLFLMLRKLLYVAVFDTTAEIHNKNKPPIKRLLMWSIKTFKLNKLFNKKKIAILGDKMLKKHSFYTAKYCSPQLWGRYKTKAIFPTGCIGEGTLLPFEDIEIRVPADYNRYLTQIYGEDYMELPPAKKRISHSSDIIFDDAPEGCHFALDPESTSGQALETSKQCINPLISIIAPVYNIAEFLPRCIDSILNQTHKNLEIILINDGSTDNSGELCDEYAKADNRIIVIHQENAGVSTARNAGLDTAQGEWICFVDTDDWIEPFMCEKLLHAALAGNKQLACCNYISCYPGGKKKERVYSDIPEILPRDLMLARILNLNYRYYNFYCYLYHHTIFTSDPPIRFDPAIHYSEDRLMLVQAVIHADGTACIPDICYNYSIREGSAVHTINNKRLTIVAALKQIVALVEPISPEHATMAKQLLIMRIMNLLSFLCHARQYKNIKWLRDEARAYVSAVMLKKGLTLKRKTKILAGLYLPKSVIGAISRKSRRNISDIPAFSEE